MSDILKSKLLSIAGGFLRPDASAYSGWGHRLSVAVLIVLGATISFYLALYEMGILPQVWDPLFGSGSERVLRSNFSRAFPIPDALLGFFMYDIELILEFVGDNQRFNTKPWPALFLGVMAAIMALAGLIFTGIQALYLHSGCMLCLSVAFLSLLVFTLTLPEARASYASVRSKTKIGFTLWGALGIKGDS